MASVRVKQVDCRITGFDNSRYRKSSSISIRGDPGVPPSGSQAAARARSESRPFGFDPRRLRPVEGLRAPLAANPCAEVVVRGRSCCVLHRITAVLPSRAARAGARACVLAAGCALTAALRRDFDGSGQFRPCNRRAVMNDKSRFPRTARCWSAARRSIPAILLDKRLRASMERHTATG